jgi:prevent-host-death family protein
MPKVETHPGRAVRAPTWKLEDAKARFSELVRRAHDEGPQEVTVRGRRAVVVVDADEFQLMAAAKPKLPLVEFLESLNMDGLDLTREPDSGREVEL